ncbi:putative cytoplasmic protein [Salmonella enterica subsp. enterica]|uniref:Putative cytoplasmic protein n=1 Tax=Salmonella enterica I TaxID=59201 RepID=A0A447MST6_SALET|nr:putative cytoplasmic protein [Salmonella enterica subsp. enterica]
MMVSKRRCGAIRYLSAQHATATCCRGCLAKWHQIPQGEPLSKAQQQYIVSVIHYWLVIQMNQQ